jgi:hypothetical protein
MQFVVEKIDKGYLVLNNKKPLVNHRNIEFNPFKQEVAELLCKDLNQIFETGRDELIKSFVYCALSTFSCYESENDFEPSYEISKSVQWDFAYRIPGGNPILHHLLTKAIEPLINFLGENYEDLSPNYAQSIEEMEDLGIEFVSDKLTHRILDLYKNFNPYQQFTVDLLFNFYERTSISLIIFWVANKISSLELHYPSYFFEGEKKTDDLNDYETAVMNFYIQRLDNLKLFLELEK